LGNKRIDPATGIRRLSNSDESLTSIKNTGATTKMDAQTGQNTTGSLKIIINHKKVKNGNKIKVRKDN
jgi:hypothetical protein